nr:hypothetical protein CFP56_19682 [Quercus suber]
MRSNTSAAAVCYVFSEQLPPRSIRFVRPLVQSRRFPARGPRGGCFEVVITRGIVVARAFKSSLSDRTAVWSWQQLVLRQWNRNLRASNAKTGSRVKYTFQQFCFRARVRFKAGPAGRLPKGSLRELGGSAL